MVVGDGVAGEGAGGVALEYGGEEAVVGGDEVLVGVADDDGQAAGADAGVDDADEDGTVGE